MSPGQVFSSASFPPDASHALSCRRLPWAVEYYHHGLAVNTDQTLPTRPKAIFGARFTFTATVVFVGLEVRVERAEVVNHTRSNTLNEP